MKHLKALVATLGDMMVWLGARRLVWLAPLVFLLIGLGGLLALAAAVPAISPFVYLLF